MKSGKGSSLAGGGLIELAKLVSFGEVESKSSGVIKCCIFYFVITYFEGFRRVFFFFLIKQGGWKLFFFLFFFKIFYI